MKLGVAVFQVGLVGAAGACGKAGPESPPVRDPPAREQPVANADGRRQAVAQNASLSIPIPDGYRDVSQKLASGVEAVILLKGTAGGPDAASINFVPAEHAPEVKYDDPVECGLFAREMSSRLKAERPTSAIVAGPSGKTCQMTLEYPDRHATVISTVLQGPNDSWTMTCAMQAGDADARHQCDATLSAVTFRQR